MASTVAILVLALLITGVVTITLYAVPIIQQADAVQVKNGDMMQSQTQRRLRDCSQSGEMTQNQERLQLRECAQNCECLCEESGLSNQGDSEQTVGNMYQNRFCEQTCICSQHRNQLGLETE